MIQLLPGADDELITKLEANVYTLESVTEMLSKGYNTKRMAREILLGFDYEILMEYHPEYKCNCSKERMDKALISLGEAELNKLIDEQGSAELSCHFCATKYTYTKDQLIALVNEAKEK